MTPTSTDEASHLEALHQTLTAEAQVVEGITQVLQLQRTAIAAHDETKLNEAINASDDMLGYLQEIAERRQVVLTELLGTTPAPNDDLATLLGTRMTPALRQAKVTLRERVEAMAAEAEITKKVIHGAANANEGAIRTLYAAPTTTAMPGAPSPYGGAAAGQPARGAGPRLIDRAG